MELSSGPKYVQWKKPTEVLNLVWKSKPALRSISDKITFNILASDKLKFQIELEILLHLIFLII